MASHATTNTSNWYLDDGTWTKVRNILLFIMLVGWAGCAAGYFLAPERFFKSYLIGFAYSTLACLGGLFFLQVMYLTGSAWSVTVRRMVEHIVAAIPVCLVLFLPVLLGLHDLYEWTHTEEVVKDQVLTEKAGFLNPTFFTIRTVIYFLLWSFLAWKITSESLKQDSDHSIKHMDSASRFSAPGLMLTFLSVSLAAFDWLMSLAPHWYSTIFGIYVFAGGAWTFIAATTLLFLAFRKNGILATEVNTEHYHDLGKWMLAITAFWAYVSFSQYMLIWYANLPEETVWYKVRWTGSWGGLSYLLIFGHFFLPFLVLLSRAPKRNLTVLGLMGVWILLMEYCDLYFIVMPNFYKEGITPHWMDFFGWLAPVSTVAVVVWSRIKGKAMVPVGDLRLEQSLAHQNI